MPPETKYAARRAGGLIRMTITVADVLEILE
jgi:hypothetical protein